MSLKDPFKKAFEPEDKSWDKEASWVEIEKLLPQKKKRRPFFIWWFGLGLFLLMIPLAWNMINQHYQKSVSQSPKMEHIIIDNTQQEKANTSNSINKEDKTLTQNAADRNSNTSLPVVDEENTTARNLTKTSSRSSIEPSALKASIRQSILEDTELALSNATESLTDSEIQVESEEEKASFDTPVMAPIPPATNGFR